MSWLLCKLLTITSILHPRTHTWSVQPSHILLIFFVPLLKRFMTTNSWRVLECVCSASGQVNTWIITVFILLFQRSPLIRHHKRADVPEINSAIFSFRFFFFSFYFRSENSQPFCSFYFPTLMLNCYHYLFLSRSHGNCLFPCSQVRRSTPCICNITIKSRTWLSSLFLCEPFCQQPSRGRCFGCVTCFACTLAVDEWVSKSVRLP